jgi:hypothetical protein
MRLGGKKPQLTRQLELPLDAWGAGELCSPRTSAGRYGNPSRVSISENRGEAPTGRRSEEEPTAAHENERSGASDLMEKVCERPNLQAALKRVRRNKGSPGIDGMTVDELAMPIKAFDNHPPVRRRIECWRRRGSVSWPLFQFSARFSWLLSAGQCQQS